MHQGGAGAAPPLQRGQAQICLNVTAKGLANLERIARLIPQHEQSLFRQPQRVIAARFTDCWAGSSTALPRHPKISKVIYNIPRCGDTPAILIRGWYVQAHCIVIAGFPAVPAAHGGTACAAGAYAAGQHATRSLDSVVDSLSKRV